MVAIRWCLAERISARRVIWWVDNNEAARYALIKGQCLSRSMNLLVREFYDAPASYASYGWIERVPSYSNAAMWLMIRLEAGRRLRDLFWAYLRGRVLDIRAISCLASLMSQLVKSKG